MYAVLHPRQVSARGQVLPFALLANYESIGERGKRQDLTPLTT